MSKQFSTVLLVIVSIFITACTEQSTQKTLRVGFNTWPGYEFIYLAKVKGMYKEQGLDVKLIELNALGDVRRAFERGQIDIMASTMVEVLIAAENTGRPLKIIAVTDASNGSDILFAQKDIKTIANLKGKRVGMEGSTVDVLVAGAALRSVGLKFNDVTVVAKSQDDLIAEFVAGHIDAIQTYPPYAVTLQKIGKYNEIFDTSKIPGEIIDTLSIAASVLEKRRNDIRKFLNAYFEAFEYYNSNQADASDIMGKREGLSGEEFRDALSGMLVFSRSKQPPYLKATGLGGKALKSASDALYDSGWLKQKININDFFVSNIEVLIK